jgi:hypothetical protein
MFLAVNAEQESLEDVTEPLTAQDPEARGDDYAGSSPVGSSMRRYH